MALEKLKTDYQLAYDNPEDGTAMFESQLKFAQQALSDQSEVERFLRHALDYYVSTKPTTKGGKIMRGVAKAATLLVKPLVWIGKSLINKRAK